MKYSGFFARSMVLCLVCFVLSIPVVGQDNSLTKKQIRDGWHLLFDGQSTAVPANLQTTRRDNMFIVPPGIVSYTFRNSFQRDVGATLDTIRALGFTNIEFSNLFGKTAVELRRLLDARGMKCTSFGTGYDDLVHRTKIVAENAKALGASFVRVAWIPHDNNLPFSVETAQSAANDFNRAGKILYEEYGLHFCYHNHGYEFVRYGQGNLFDYMVANTDAKYVNFELDILWAFFAGVDPASLLSKYGERFKLMHVKDLRKGIAGNFSGSTAVENDVAVGQGQIDIAAVMIAAKKSGIEYYYIEDESDNARSQVPQSLAFLKSL